jgi:hypothetical protein
MCNFSLLSFTWVVYGCADKQILFQKTTRDEPGRFSYSQADMFTITDQTSNIQDNFEEGDSQDGDQLNEELLKIQELRTSYDPGPGD